MEKALEIYVSKVLYGYSLTYSISTDEKDSSYSIPVLNHGASDADRTELMKSIQDRVKKVLKEKGEKNFKIIFNRYLEIKGSVGPGSSTLRRPIKTRDAKLFLEALQLPL